MDLLHAVQVVGFVFAAGASLALASSADFGAPSFGASFFSTLAAGFSCLDSALLSLIGSCLVSFA